MAIITDFTDYEQNQITVQTRQSKGEKPYTLCAMKTKHWDIEGDLALNDNTLTGFKFNRGGKGHICQSKHRTTKRPSEKFTFFVITWSLCDKKCIFSLPHPPSQGE